MSENKLSAADTVRETFNQYFSMTGRKSFKQFYYDWHVDAMCQPFADLADYFCANFSEPEPAFKGFVAQFKQNVSEYNPDSPDNARLKCRKYAVTKDGRLSQLVDQLESFGFQFRQFVYSFAAKTDHDREFCQWVLKPNMPNAHAYGLHTACRLLDVVAKNFNSVMSAADRREKALFLTDAALRSQVAADYKYNREYTFQNRRRLIKQVCRLRQTLADEYQIAPRTPQFIETFQVETHTGANFGKYTPNGFELEFYVPEQIGRYDVLSNYLQQKTSWKKVHFSNSDSTVYQDKEAAGVIMRDESLTPYNHLAPVEFASRVMTSRADEKQCLELFDAFDQGYVNVHCSLHQHISNRDLDLNGYKRLVKRMMQHEQNIVRTFAAPERHDDRLLYATYISHNLSSDGTRDYPLLCLMADLCDTKQELTEMASFGRKYKTLNIMPEQTVEFRFMNAHFNKEFVSAFLQFNRDMVNSAASNDGTHLNRPLAAQYGWKQNRRVDNKTIIKPLSYYYQVEYDKFRPQQKIPRQAIAGEQQYAWMITQALNETGKQPYLSPVLAYRARSHHGRK